MSLSSGTKLGPYQIQHVLGTGGMGEVYKARDTRLDRSVAIKVLSPEIAADAQLRERFEREARTVAALEHPHICGIYDVGQLDGLHFLVMPCLEGQTLAARLQQGPLPLAQALTIARELADALDKAHRQGIVHRDLKPSNVMLTRSGSKLLDFGLAKLRRAGGPISMSGMVQMATTTPGTAQGVILGTVQYMAPEQVEGREVDARTDLWGLGTVLYEMLTGTRPFDGDTPASVIGSILKDDPRPLSTSVQNVPALVEHVIARCLTKDPDERWQAAADVAAMLVWVRQGPNESASGTSRPPAARRMLALLTGLTLLAVAGAGSMLPGWMAHRREATPAVARATILPAPDTIFSAPPASVATPQVAVSPDGRYVAFVAEQRGGRPMLWIRPIDAIEPRVLPGTEDALYPFWKPDSQALGFFARGKLKTIELTGGPPTTLSDAPLDSRGGTWNDEGTILFAPAATDIIYRIAARGGPVTPVTALNASRRENSHRFPSFLPDGRHFIYAVRAANAEEWGLAIATLDSPTDGQLLVNGTHWNGQIVRPGHLLFMRGSALMSQRIDLQTRQLQGEPVAIASPVGNTTTSFAGFSASHTGVLVYALHPGLTGTLRWFDRAGAALETVAPLAGYLDFELSPDEQSLAMSRVDPELNSADIWILDRRRNVSTRFTSSFANDSSPHWAPDGSRVVFRSNRSGTTDLFEKRTNGAEEQRLLHTGTNLITSDWSVDGRNIVYTDTKTATGFDIWVWPWSSTPVLAVRTVSNAMHGRLSPDGRWMAYASDESGQWQVYVQPYPPTGDKKQISAEGGSEPRWRRDGAELFFLSSDMKVMSAGLPNGDPFAASVPRSLFQTRVPLTGNPYRSSYTVSRDGQRFLVNVSADQGLSTPLGLLVNWPALHRD